MAAVYVVYVNPRCGNVRNSSMKGYKTKKKKKNRLGVNRYAEIQKKANGLEIMNRNGNRVQVRIPYTYNINGIVYHYRQMKDFLKILIHPLDIVKIDWLDLKIDSLNKERSKLDSIEWYQPNGVLIPISY